MNTVELEAGESLHANRQDSGAINSDANGLSGSLLSRERKQKFDLLLHLIANLSRPIVLCGPDGIGKTTVLREVENHRQTGWQCCFVDSSPTTTFDGVRGDIINSEGGIDGRALETSRNQNTTDFLNRMALKGRLVVLLIDNAGVLIPGLVKAICEFADSHKALRLVFAIRPDHLHVKATSDFALDHCHVVDLPPLTEKQCGEFMQNLSAGPKAALAFEAVTSVLVEKVYKETHGVPGEIIKLLPNIAKITNLKGNTPSGTTILVVVVGFVLLGVLIATRSNYFDGDISSLTMDRTNRSATKREVNEFESKSSEVPQPIVSKSETFDSGHEDFTVKSAPDQGFTVDNAEKSDELLTISADQLIEELTSTVPDVSQYTGREKPTPSKRAGDGVSAHGNHHTSEETPDQNPSQKSRHVDAPPLGTTESKEVKGKKINEEKDQTVSVEIAGNELVQKPGSQSESDNDAVDISGVNGSDWLLKQAPDKWSLQLIVVSRLDALRKFVEKHPSLESLSVIRSPRKNKTLYTLFHGSYSTRKEAKTAAEKLPSALRKSWPRRYKSIHREINSNRPN